MLKILINFQKKNLTPYQKEFREKVINKVYCSNCGVIKIVDYVIIEKDDGILLVGACDKCGKEVARLLENLW